MSDTNGTKVIINHYLYGICRAAKLSAVAFLLAYFINDNCSLSKLWMDCIQIFGIVLAVAALYGKCGWEIQTWDGNTPTEKLNKYLEEILLSFGYFAAMFGIILSMMK